MRIPLRGLEVTAEAERAEKHPRVFTGIRLKYRVQGEVPARKLERAIALSSRTYCSVGAMLGTTAAIEHEYEILPEDPE
jgi:putative redox protein